MKTTITAIQPVKATLSDDLGCVAGEIELAIEVITKALGDFQLANSGESETFARATSAVVAELSRLIDSKDILRAMQAENKAA